jgi:hypothetical protein
MPCWAVNHNPMGKPACVIFWRGSSPGVSPVSTPSAIDRLVDFYEEQAAAADAQTAVRLLLTAMLQSPLAHSKQVQECATINWFRYAYGRAEIEHDECTIEHLSRTFVDSGGDIRELLLQLTQTDAFRSLTTDDARRRWRPSRPDDAHGRCPRDAEL